MKRVVFLLFFSILDFFIFEKGVISMVDLKDKKIVMIIAHEDFRDEELSVPLDVFKKYGADVKVASSSLSMAKGKLGMKIKPDILYSDIDAKNYDAIIFVGGPGCPVYWNDPKAHKIVKDAAAAGKVLAAICAAPPTLANAGVLKGKRATTFPLPDGEQQLIAGGAKYTAKAVEVDGSIVTANGPQSAKQFAEEIAKLLAR